ncbi:MAG: Lipoate-protein ligase A [Calditrichaeota bacterium]|nr:Lipoate-protein ligase A [Calditrichota bacterium]
MRDDSRLPFPVTGYDLDTPYFDEVKRTGRPNLRIYRPEGAMVVLGRGSDPERELFIERIVADGVRVHRRPGGGCAVVLDPGNVIVAVALAAPGLTRTKELYDRCTAWLIAGIARAGVSGVRHAGISDLAVAGRKIAGSAVYRAKDLFYYAVTLLVNPDLSLIPRYLPHPPREPDYRRGRGHLEFITTLRDIAGIDDAGAFSDRLRADLSADSLAYLTR